MTLTLIDKCRIFIAAIAQNFHPYAFCSMRAYNHPSALATQYKRWLVCSHLQRIRSHHGHTHSRIHTRARARLVRRVMLLVGCCWCRSFQIAIISYNGACFVTIMYYTDFYAVLWYCTRFYVTIVFKAMRLAHCSRSFAHAYCCRSFGAQRFFSSSSSLLLLPLLELTLFEILLYWQMFWKSLTKNILIVAVVF